MRSSLQDKDMLRENRKKKNKWYDELQQERTNDIQAEMMMMMEKQ
jgi:hypothetical protein